VDVIGDTFITKNLNPNFVKIINIVLELFILFFAKLLVSMEGPLIM